MRENVTIHAFHQDATEQMLIALEKLGLNATECLICEESIVATERPPYYLKEKWDAWRHKKKFYDWNIGAVSSWGVCCDKGICFTRLLDKQREERLRSSVTSTKRE